MDKKIIINTYYVSLYLKVDSISGEKSIVPGDIFSKIENAEREFFITYKKLRITSVYITEEEYNAIKYGE